MTRLPLLALLGALTLSACDSAEPDEVVDLSVQTAADVEADPAVSIDGPPASTGRYTLYDLDAGEVVLASSETDAAVRAADSTGTAWDIGFQATTLIFNGGTSGPGAGSAQVLAEAFADVAEAPAAGYAVDGSNTSCPAVQTPVGEVPGSPFAVCTGSGNGWYSYTDGAITPGEGGYAKVRILSYYRGNPATPSGDSRYYTFEYVVQPDGSRDFQATTLD